VPHDTTPDVESSSEGYAKRFEGSVGRWFLDTQARVTLDLLRSIPPGSLVLDVGGGHAQLVPPLVGAGHTVVVVGSVRASRARLEPWLRIGNCLYVGSDLARLPFRDRTFPAALCFRLLPHFPRWPELIGELCRVSASTVVVDYPVRRSVNIVASGLFAVKKGIEGNTRPFRLFTRGEVRRAFEEGCFTVTAERPQFLFPMAWHRLVGSALLARALESTGRLTLLTTVFGSPLIVSAEPGQIRGP